MRTLKRLAVFLLVFIFCPAAAPAQSGDISGQKWQSGLSRMADEYSNRGLKVGISVVEVGSKENIYSYKADKYFIPASLVKIYTTAAALEILGPAYTFKTEIYSDSRLNNAEVKNLYFKGDGNPKLVIEQLWLLTRRLEQNGLKRVRGDIVIDESFFPTESNENCRGSSDNLRAYCAPLGSASLNFNTVTIYIEPGSRAGSPAEIIIDPKCDYIQVVNRMLTSPPRGKSNVTVSRRRLKESEVLTISGHIPANSKKRTQYYNIVNPPLYLAGVFRQLLQESGISVEGGSRVGNLPEDAEFIAAYPSEPLWKMAADMNKFSNNFMAEQLLRVLGAFKYGPPGDRDKGLRCLNAYLAEKGMPPNSYKLYDGSGFSRQNRFTPAQITNFLSLIANEQIIAPEFATALSLAAADGTMKKRLHETTAVQRMRAKTGSLSGVSSLAGFVTTSHGRHLAFTVIVEGPLSYRQLLDVREALALEIMEYPGR